MRVTVSAPASTANIGPGFDSLGAALDLRFRLTVSNGGSGRWEMSGTDDAPDPSLVVSAIEAVCPSAGALDGAMEFAIPLGRGLGSSASGIAAGLLAGCALAGRRPDPDELLAIGLPLEGHPDNLAPALFGGVTVVVPGPRVLRFEPAPSVRPAILVPRERLSTAQARGVLPEDVPRADAIANIARASGLVALLTGTVEPTAATLLACTEDLLHQPQRAPLMPRTTATIAALREAGVPAAVSGAGPSIVCLLTAEIDDVFRSMASGMDGWTSLDVGWSPDGARIEEVSE